MISVIVPTYNRPDLLIRAIDSLTNQSYSDWECYIIDDSLDTATQSAVVARYRHDSRINYQKKPKHIPRGAVYSRNYGLQLIKGDWIQWLDDDDYLDAHKFENQMKIVSRRNLGNDLLVCPWKHVDDEKVGKLNMSGFPDVLNTRMIYNYYIQEGTYFPIHSFLIPATMKDIEWDISLTINDDAEYISRIYKGIKQIYHSENSLVFYYNHSGNRISTTSEDKTTLLMLSLKKIYSNLQDSQIAFKKYHRKRLIKLLLFASDEEKKDLLTHKKILSTYGVYYSLLPFYSLKLFFYKLKVRYL